MILDHLIADSGRTRWVVPSAIRALLLIAALIAIPFFIAKFIADMTGDRR